MGIASICQVASRDKHVKRRRGRYTYIRFLPSGLKKKVTYYFKIVLPIKFRGMLAYLLRESNNYANCPSR
jgi:hypothetical protein